MIRLMICLTLLGFLSIFLECRNDKNKPKVEEDFKFKKGGTYFVLYFNNLLRKSELRNITTEIMNGENLHDFNFNFISWDNTTKEIIEKYEDLHFKLKNKDVKFNEAFAKTQNILTTIFNFKLLNLTAATYNAQKFNLIFLDAAFSPQEFRSLNGDIIENIKNGKAIHIIGKQLNMLENSSDDIIKNITKGLQTQLVNINFPGGNSVVKNILFYRDPNQSTKINQSKNEEKKKSNKAVCPQVGGICGNYGNAFYFVINYEDGLPDGNKEIIKSQIKQCKL